MMTSLIRVGEVIKRLKAEIERLTIENANYVQALKCIKALEAKPVGEDMTDEQLFALREAHEKKYGQYVDNEDFIMVCREVLKLKKAPPSIEALIDEIDEWRISERLGDSLGKILDKWRTK